MSVMLKVGRYTAAALLVTVGVLLFIDQLRGTEHLSLLLDWWPVLLISLGSEYLIFNFMNSKKERPMRLDIGGLFTAVLISAVVIAVTQSAALPGKIFNSINIKLDDLNFSFSSESGYRFDKQTVHIPIASGTKTILIENPNGTVVMKAGTAETIEVQTTVWVDKLGETDAKNIADQSAVEYTAGNTLKITAKGKEYTGGFSNKRKPRMNLVITVPSDKEADYELHLINGKITVSGIPVFHEMKAKTTNGEVSISGIEGNVQAGTTNGTVDLTDIKGSVDVDTINGTVTAKGISGDVKADTTNGMVTASQIGGNVDIDTTNGRIVVEETAGSVIANAANGSITVSSSTLGGNYDLKTVHGSVTVRIPESANVEVDASTRLGSVSSDLPLTMEKRKITGTLGNGQYQIKIDTNSSIEVNKFD